MKQPYIGICDFTTAKQVYKMGEEVTKTSGGDDLKRENMTPRKLMVGIMMSYKTLNGIPSKWEKIWPAKETIKDIFFEKKHPYLNTIHYADYSGINILENLIKVFNYGDEECELDAIQLDMVWPNPEEIKKFKDETYNEYPRLSSYSEGWIKSMNPPLPLQLILQINPTAFEQIDNSPEKLINKLSDYNDSLDYILLDKSAGIGKPLNANELRPYIEILSEKRPDLGIAVAGGLGPNSLHLLEPLLKDYPDLSIDAQSQLRVSGDATEPINWTSARIYIDEALNVFEKCARIHKAKQSIKIKYV